MLPILRSRTIRFRGGPGALVRFSFPFEIGESPRCCPVLRGLRDRCIAAMLATQKRKSVDMLHNPPGGSDRFPAGGGTLVRFDFHRVAALRGGGRSQGGRAMDLRHQPPGSEPGALAVELQGNTIRQPELHRSLADTSGVRRYQRFGGIGNGRASWCCPECLADPNGADCCLPHARTRCVFLSGGTTGNRTPIYAMPLRRLAIGRWPRNGRAPRTRTG